MKKHFAQKFYTALLLCICVSLALVPLFLSSSPQAQTVGQTRNNSNNFQVFDGTVFDTPDYGSLGGCSVSGQMQYSGGTMRFCNGSTWRNLDSGVNNGGCSTAGQIRRNTTWLEFCNGTNWRKINPTHIDGACLNDGASNNLCNDGTANDAAIADTSAQWRWRCDGLYGGSNSGTCYKHKPVNGTCSGTHYNCATGTSNAGAISDTSTQWRWRCDGQYGGSNSGTCSQTRPGLCGSAESGSSYSAPSSNLCTTGTATSVATNATTFTWSCTGSSTDNCSKPRRRDGICINEGASNNLCSVGSANDGAVGDTGTQWRWRCDGINGGSNSGTCYKNKPVNGVCNNSGRNLCSAGSSNDGAISDTSSHYRWRCDGQYGGSNSGTCSYPKPINGVCNNATRNACSAGSSNDGAIADTTVYWRWRCDGQYGGSNSGTCQKNKPVNGVCNNATRNACSAGSSNDGAVSDTTAQWRWRCDGQYGGSNSGTCAKNKASCSATTISNCSLGSTASGSSTGSCAGGYTGSCSYLCNNGAWSANSNSCSAVPTPVNGVCNNSSRNACTAGTSNDGAISDTTTHYRWRCDGQNGGSNSGTCSIARPGVCGSAASGGAVASQPSSNQCSYGTYQDLSDTGSYWQWRCNGNPNSPTCQRARITAVNGSCGSANGSTTLLGMPSGAAACSAGTQTNTNTSTLGSFTSYTWDCAGSGGGSTASCSGSGSSGGATCTSPTGGTMFDGICATYSGFNCEYHCCGGVLSTQNCNPLPYTFSGICAPNCP